MNKRVIEKERGERGDGNTEQRRKREDETVIGKEKETRKGCACKEMRNREGERRKRKR